MKERKNQANSDEHLKLKLVYITRNREILDPGLIQEAEFPTNLMLKDEIKKKYQFKKFAKVKISNQNNEDHFRWEKKHDDDDEIVKKKSIQKIISNKKTTIKRMRTKFKRLKN
jgi:hypothetical protein